MRITLSQQLIDYMVRKGYAAVVVDAVNPIGCCADISEVVTSFAKAGHAAQLKEKGCAVHTPEGSAGEQGLEVLVCSRGLHYDDEAHLGLRSFLGVKDVTVEGIRPWKL
jgi:hypothetical protein